MKNFFLTAVLCGAWCGFAAAPWNVVVDGHDGLSPGVCRTTHSTGARVCVNCDKTSVSVDGATVGAEDWLPVE